MKPALLAAALTALAVSSHASAQTASPLFRPGAEARMTVPSMSAVKDLRGTLVSADSATVVLATGRAGADTLHIPRELVRKVEVRAERLESGDARMRGLRRGGVTGLVAGGTFGLLYQFFKRERGGDNSEGSIWKTAAVAGAGAGGAGMVFGFAFGTRENWQPVLLPPPPAPAETPAR
jgi:hypothetical protein